MAMDKNTTKLLTGVFVVLVWLFLALFGWCIGELSRFDPFFTSIECTNPYLNFPVVAGTGIVANKQSMEMECSSKNQIKFEIGVASAGDVMSVAADKSTTSIGSVSLGSAATLDHDAVNTKVKLAITFTMAPAAITAAQARLAAQKLPPTNATVTGLPLVFSVKWAVNSNWEYLIVGDKDSNFIQRKYCALLYNFGGANGAMKSVTVTKCAASAADAITAAEELSKDGGPSSANDHSAGYFDILDPDADYVTDKDGSFATTMGIFTRTVAILALISVGMAMVCATLYYRAKGNA